MKVLYITNVAGKDGINNFSMATQIACQNIGLEFHIAKNFSKTSCATMTDLETRYKIKLHHIDFVRNPFHPFNIRALKQLIKVIKEENINIIHCNTPVGGVIGRIAGLICGVHPVIYQSHGFHFFKGAPLLNWILYYPAERIMAHWTDYILTINKEDYGKALTFKLREHGKVYQTLGVGLETDKYRNCIVDKNEYRKRLGLPADAILLISVGEVSKRKNHIAIIKALSKIKCSNIYFIICGEGKLMPELKRKCKELNVDSQIFFLGRRNDIAELCNISDIYCFPSRREGMGIAAMEGMAAGLPLISSNIQGIKDYSKQGVTGYALKYNDIDGYADAIKVLAGNKELRKKYGDFNRDFVKRYDRTNCVKCYEKIYTQILGEINDGTG